MIGRKVTKKIDTWKYVHKIILGEVLLHAYRRGHQHGTAVDDVVGSLESGIADPFVLAAIVPHDKVHGFIANIHRIEQLAVTPARCFFVFLYGRTALALAHMQGCVKNGYSIYTFYLP